jgi:hypothetical protein
MYDWTLHVYFPFDSSRKSMSKGAQFWGFLGSRVRGVLGGISSILLDIASFGGPNLVYGLLVKFCSGERLVEFPVVLCCRCFVSGSVWISVGPFGGFGISCLGPVWPASYTGLTGVGTCCGSSQCSVMVLELLVLLRSQVGVGGCWFLGWVALQWLCGLGQLW